MSDWAPVLHLWQPFSYHDESYVVGNRDGLKRLRDALDIALRSVDDANTTVRDTAYIADGEGYDLVIQLVADTTHLATPYTSADAIDWREDAVKPWEATE